MIESWMPQRLTGSAFVAFAFVACSFPDYAFPGPTVNDICTDGKPSGSESGLDCGGICPPCRAGEGCGLDKDCVSTLCTDGVCQIARCDDNVKNNDETDLDCGSGCDPCLEGQYCNTGFDCTTGVCLLGVCQSAQCDDNVTNGNETYIDCGGSCTPCPNTRPCISNNDCASESCFQSHCVDAGCTDMSKNNDESDIDCGGSCAPCAADALCVKNSDCESLICAASTDRCTQASCSDAVVNADESDVDCGGACRGCNTGQNCLNGEDCDSTVCNSGLCVPAAPTNLKLGKTAWLAMASSTFVDATVEQAIDGNAGTRWTSGADQIPGMWFEIDLGQQEIFFKIELDATVQEADAPGQLDVYLSDDGTYATPALTGVQGATVTNLEWDNAQVARYVHLELTDGKASWWSIGEITLYR